MRGACTRKAGRLESSSLNFTTPIREVPKLLSASRLVSATRFVFKIDPSAVEFDLSHRIEGWLARDAKDGNAAVDARSVARRWTCSLAFSNLP
jgi:hypothetical protein